MRRLVSLLIAINLHAILVTAQNNDNIDALISSVFGNALGNQSPNQHQNQPVTQPPKSNNENLDSLINSVFNTNNSATTTSTLILGTQNNPSPTKDNCECVVYYQCHEGKILENGIGIIDIKFGGENKLGSSTPCKDYLEVCCKPPDVLTNPDDRITPPPIERKGCGVRHPDGVGFRITGDTDNEAQFGEFPWMVAVLKKNTIGNSKIETKYQCGGALIHQKAVLTAAHCVNKKAPSEFVIRAGEWDTQTKNEIYPHQDRDVETIIVHEKFHSGALYYDIAVLILKEPIDLTENVDVVCLPEQGDVFDGSRCFASGWGKDKFGTEEQNQVILKKIDLPIVPRNVCQDTLRKTRLGKYFVLDPSFICAGGEAGKDTCKGDGGSPLVCPLANDPSRYVQAGIVAWGIGCGENQTPGIYANVAHTRRWIDEQITYHNLDSTIYQYKP